MLLTCICTQALEWKRYLKEEEQLLVDHNNAIDLLQKVRALY
jgi:hypothetical protein